MSDFTERQWAMGGRKAKAQAEAVRAPVRRAVQSAARKGLAGVPFASPVGHKAALDAGLAWPNFEGVKPSSPRGYTAADVRKVRDG